MSVTVVESRPQSGGFFDWRWLPRGGNRAHGTVSTPSMDRLSSSSSSSSSERDSSSDVYSRSSSASSHSCSEDGMVVLKEFDFVPDESEMRRVFERFDENNDGLICGKDLHRFMGRFGVEMSEEEAVSMLQSVDKNADGCVDFEEFYSLYRSLSDEMAGPAEDDAVDEEEDTLEQVFKVFDKNGDGHITPQELQEVLMKLGIPEARSIRNCEEMIQRVDSNGDKKIDFSEFKAMMCSNCFSNLC